MTGETNQGRRWALAQAEGRRALSGPALGSWPQGHMLPTRRPGQWVTLEGEGLLAILQNALWVPLGIASCLRVWVWERLVEAEFAAYCLRKLR